MTQSLNNNNPLSLNNHNPLAGTRRLEGPWEKSPFPQWTNTLIKSSLKVSLRDGECFVVHGDYSPLSTAKATSGLYQLFTVGTQWNSGGEAHRHVGGGLPGLLSPGVSHSDASPHSASLSWSKLPFMFSYQFMASAASASGKQIQGVTCRIYLSFKIISSLLPCVLSSLMGQRKVVDLQVV